MKLKSTLFAGVLVASLAAPAFANDAPLAAPLPQFTAADTQMLFEQDVKPMQLAALSAKETEGAWLVWGARMGFGGLSSGVRYGVSNWGTPQYSAWGHSRAVGYGAAGGLLGWNSWSSATLGAAAGAAGQRWGW